MKPISEGRVRSLADVSHATAATKKLRKAELGEGSLSWQKETEGADGLEEDEGGREEEEAHATSVTSDVPIDECDCAVVSFPRRSGRGHTRARASP